MSTGLSSSRRIVQVLGKPYVYVTFECWHPVCDGIDLAISAVIAILSCPLLIIPLYIIIHWGKWTISVYVPVNEPGNFCRYCTIIIGYPAFYQPDRLRRAVHERFRTHSLFAGKMVYAVKNGLVDFIICIG